MMSTTRTNRMLEALFSLDSRKGILLECKEHNKTRNIEGNKQCLASYCSLYWFDFAHTDQFYVHNGK
mgnify:CR=1 FL=1